MNDATAAGRGPAQAHEDESGTSGAQRAKREDESADQSAGQVSSASSSFENVETSVGGADAVPDTPDRNSEPQ